MNICPECGGTRFVRRDHGILECEKCGFRFARHGVGSRNIGE